jgi:hypothetical protein
MSTANAKEQEPETVKLPDHDQVDFRRPEVAHSVKEQGWIKNEELY